MAGRLILLSKTKILEEKVSLLVKARANAGSRHSQGETSVGQKQLSENGHLTDALNHL